MLAAAAVAIFIAPGPRSAPFYYKNSYQDMDLSWYMGLGLRDRAADLRAGAVVAVLALVPRHETWYSDLGTRTLYCYLLHGVPVLIAKEQGWLDAALAARPARACWRSAPAASRWRSCSACRRPARCSSGCSSPG